MLYKFQSPATAEVIMMGPIGDQILRIIGKEPAGKGILEPAGIPAAMQALEAAVGREESQVSRSEADDDTAGDEADSSGAAGVGLRQRVWPLVEMMKRAHAAGEEIVWDS